MAKKGKCEMLHPKQENLKEMLHVKKNRGCLKEFNSNISRIFSEI